MAGLFAVLNKPLNAFHYRRLGFSEAFNRQMKAAVIAIVWPQRHRLLEPPPCGWFAFRLCLIYWRLTLHRKLIVYGELFNAASEPLYRMKNLAGAWEAQRKERDRQRAEWQTLAALFRAWEERDRRKERHKTENGQKESRRKNDRRDGQRQREQQQSASASADPYALALGVLGLSEPFDKAALKRAWKAAIFKAHPDRGGSTAQAQAINAAKDFIMRRHGW